MEASHYTNPGDGRMHCHLCPHECKISKGKTGICRTRKNTGEELSLLNYGRMTSLSLDPIEKKPLYHFHPGTSILSAGGLGCNFSCKFCQNWQISLGEVPTRQISPQQLVAEAVAHAPENIGVAFTYNEPMIWFEFIRDTAPMLRDAGQKVVLVTNGFINPEPFAEIAPLIDAMNVDLKSYDDDFYKKYCGGRVEPVKHTIASAVRAGIWVEVTQLVITGLNDSESQIGATAQWLASLSKDIPLHLSRYFPNYKLDNPPTPAATLRRAHEICREHLNHVYVGNLSDTDFGHTLCPSCGTTAISREGYYTRTRGKGKSLSCARCGNKIAGVE